MSIRLRESPGHEKLDALWCTALADMHSLTPSLLLLEYVETFSSSGEVLAGISTACTSVVSVAWVRQQVSSSLAPFCLV